MRRFRAVQKWHEAFSRQVNSACPLSALPRGRGGNVRGGAAYAQFYAIPTAQSFLSGRSLDSFDFLAVLAFVIIHIRVLHIQRAKAHLRTYRRCGVGADLV